MLWIVRELYIEKSCVTMLKRFSKDVVHSKHFFTIKYLRKHIKRIVIQMTSCSALFLGKKVKENLKYHITHFIKFVKENLEHLQT